MVVAVVLVRGTPAMVVLAVVRVTGTQAQARVVGCRLQLRHLRNWCGAVPRGVVSRGRLCVVRWGRACARCVGCAR